MALWHSIYEQLSAEIGRGHYRPGEKLPTEKELAKRFDVNRNTLRHALKALQDAGFVISKRGLGSFVRTKPVKYRINKNTRFSRNLADAHQQSSIKILRLETRHADVREKAILQLPRDAQVHVVEGIGYSNNVPILHFTSIFPTERLPDFLTHLQRTNSITTALAACGVAEYERARTEITAILAGANLSTYLNCQIGAPLIQTKSLNTSNGSPIEYGTSLFVASLIALTVGEGDAL